MSAPRWKTCIENALKTDPKSNVYQLATAVTPASESPQTALPIPAVRSLIHRDFLTFTSNPALTLLLTTTDIRTPKARQIDQNARVELAWWIAGAQEQYRIKGRAWILPSREAAESAQAGLDVRDGGDSTKSIIQSAARSLLETFPATRLSGGDASFNWEAKRREVFESMSGHMRASWARPVPGSKLEGGYEAAKRWPEALRKLSELESSETDQKGDEEERREVLYALKNFALVVIEPEEVDHVELGVVPNRRTVYSYHHEEAQGKLRGGWRDEIVVP